MKLTPQQEAVLQTLENATISEFAELARLAGLDPAHDFIGADLSGVDFGEADLSEFDLTGADLSGANLARADFSRTRLRSATLSGASLPDFPLTPQQLGAIVAVRGHLRTGARRALVSMPTGTGVSRVIASVIADLHADAPVSGGLILCANRTTVNRLLQTLATLGMTDIVRLSPDERLEPRADWRITTYQDVRRRLSRGGPVLNDDTLVAGPIILTEADRLSFKDTSPILGRLVGLSQVAFSSDTTTHSARLERHFEHDLVFKYSLDDALRDGAIRPSLIMDRRQIIASELGRRELNKAAVARAAGDFVGILVSEGLALEKSVFLCSTPTQVRVAQAAIDASYRRLLAPELIEGDPSAFAGVPDSVEQVGRWLDDVEGSPRVICCRANMISGAFNSAPECVGTVLRNIGRTTRSLFDAARPPHKKPGRPILGGCPRNHPLGRADSLSPRRLLTPV